MEIKMTTGCLYESLTIDGTEEINLSEEKRKEALEKVLTVIKSEDLNELLYWLVPKYAQDYECSETACDCCGDYVDTYTLTI